jgi:hypothetical protein
VEEETQVMKDHKETRELLGQAQLFRMQIAGHSGDQKYFNVDELLLFLYRLRDGYRIVRTTSGRVHSSSFAFLQDLLYQLESRPDEALRSPEWKAQIESLLQDLIDGKLTISKVG